MVSLIQSARCALRRGALALVIVPAAAAQFPFPGGAPPQPTPAAPATPAPRRNGPTPAGNPALWPGRGVTRLLNWDARRAEFWKSRARDQGAVVFVGDSITEFWSGLPAAFPRLRVANRGIAGDTSRGVLFRLNEDVLTLHPRAVVLLIGTNDLTDDGRPEDIAANIRLILDRLAKAAPAAPVIVCHVMPRDRQPGKFPERIQALNKLIDTTVASRPRTAVCDTWSIFATADGTASRAEFPDMLHPNAAGYAKWKAALDGALRQLKLEN